MQSEDSSEDAEKRLHLRIPPDLKKALQQAAEADGRTLSNWVLQAVREKLARKGGSDA